MKTFEYELLVNTYEDDLNNFGVSLNDKDFIEFEGKRFNLN